MIPDTATTITSSSTAESQPAASGPQPAPATPATQPTPVQLLWEVAYLAFGLMTRLVHVLQPIQQYYPKQALLLARLLIDIPRILLTIRYAPERVTIAQLRHLTRARHLLQALFNYTIPLGARTPPSAAATAHQHPSAFPENATPLGPRTSSSATTPSPAVPAVPEVPEVPEVPAVPGVASPNTPSTASSKVPAVSTPEPSPTSQDSHPSHDSHSSQSAIPNPQSSAPHSAFRIQHSAFSPFVPDVHTLLQALKSDTLPANCAGALFENPGEDLVRALHQLHAIYFSLYPNQPPSSSQSPSPSPSPSPSSGNLQSAIHNPQSSPAPSPSQSSVNPQSSLCNLQSGNPQSDAPT